MSGDGSVYIGPRMVKGEPSRIEAGSTPGGAGGGHGLRIVDELSLAWGAIERSGLVWADVRIA